MSYLEESFARGLVKHQFPKGWVREHIFHPTRRWRFDFCYINYKIALEIEGSTHIKSKRKSRHLTIKGFTEDTVKYNSATILGWSVLRVTTPDVQNGRAYEYLYEMLIAKGVKPW